MNDIINLLIEAIQNVSGRHAGNGDHDSMIIANAFDLLAKEIETLVANEDEEERNSAAEHGESFHGQ